MKTFALASCIGILAFASANAQETPKFSFDIGGGFTNPVGTAGNVLNEGWNVGAGAGYNFSSHVGVKLNVNYNSFGINSATLSSIGVPDGADHILSATIDPVIHLTPKHHVDVYVTGGGGMFHLYQDFTQPAVAVTTVYNPFFGLYPAAFGVNEILSSYSVTKPGFDVGAGVAFGSIGHGKFFAEAKWDHMFQTHSHIDYLPVTFGFRW